MGNIGRRLKSMMSNQHKVWKQLADELEAEYFQPGGIQSPYVLRKTKVETIKLDSFVKTVGRTPVTFTRFQMECTPRKQVSFRIVRKTMLNKGVPKQMEVVETASPQFNRLFRFYASSPLVVQQIFDTQLLDVIARQQPYNDIQIEMDSQRLELTVAPLNKDTEQLKSLFKLMEEIGIRL